MCKRSQLETVFIFLSFKELHPPASIISRKNEPNSESFGLINREGSHATNGQVDGFVHRKSGDANCHGIGPADEEKAREQTHL